MDFVIRKKILTPVKTIIRGTSFIRTKNYEKLESNAIAMAMAPNTPE